MDHVIESLKDWARAFDHDSEAYKCINNAIAELEKYYTEYDNG